MLSIRQRLTLWYTLVLMVMLLAFAGIVLVGGTWQLRLATDRQLMATARALAEAALRGEELLLVDTSYRILTVDGQVVRSSGLPSRRVQIDPDALAAAREGRTTRATLSLPLMGPQMMYGGGLFHASQAQIRMITMPLGNPPRYILQVGKLDDSVQRLRTWLIIALVVALGLGLPLAALGGWWLAGRALAPVRAMTATARRISARNLAERLPRPPQDDELGQLASTLNSLLDRLQAAFGRERRFITDVSHDLRTPLALMKSVIGVALNRPRSAEELQGTLAEIDRQLDQVAGLLDKILFLSRADSDQLALNYQPTNLSELLTDLYETTAPYAAEEHGLSMAANIASDLWVEGDHDQLTRLFLNLLDNAMEYTPAGGSIQITARTEGRKVLVSVKDTGVGIAPEDLPHVFERFYRADKARAGDQRHHGLGLSIAQAIAQAHGGEISVTSTPGQGSCFTVSLPLLTARAK